MLNSDYFIRNIFKEICKSFCRYLHRTGRLKNSKCYILYLGEKICKGLCKENGEVDISNDDIKIEKVIEEIFTNPLPIYIIGFESNPSKNEKIIFAEPRYEKAKEFRFFCKVFPEIIGYVSVPFNPNYLMIEDAKNLIGEKLEKVKENLENILNNKIYERIQSVSQLEGKIPKSWVEVFIKLGKYFDTEIEWREKIVHDASGQGEANFLIQLANMFAGLIRLTLTRCNIKLLLIDNRPDQDLVKIDERFNFLGNVKLNEIFLLFEPVIETYIFDGKIKDFRWLLEEIEKRKGKEKKEVLYLPCKKVQNYENAGVQEMDIEKFDAILVDMYLESGQPDGLKILHQLTEVYPEIPAFVLSISDDFALIREAIRFGADYYIIKNQTFSVPYVLWDYIISMGKILEYFDKQEYYRNLLGNIRYWHFKKNLLWFGDKCYHMIDHAFNHTLNDWNHLNQIIIPLLKRRGKDGFFCDSDNKELSDELLYSFCMAIWLHDIGHKGTSHYGEPHLIRDNHGYIAGELILKYPEVFNIIGKDDYYKKFDFSDVSAVEAIYGREREKLTICEMIALFVMYHKSNTPIDEESYIKLRGSHRRIPVDYYKNKEPKPENVLTLEKILKKRAPEIKGSFLKLAALFRFVDSIDIHTVRVGDITESKLKKIVIENDKEYQYRKLAREVKNISYHYTKTPTESALFVKSFYNDVIEKIENNELTSLPLSEELIREPEVLENYKALVDYAAFIALQPDHFDLHLSVKEMQFKYIKEGHLLITLITDRDEKWLKEKKVRERGREEQSIYERLIGENNYIFKEIEDVKRYLKDFFSNITVKLKHETDKFHAVKIEKDLKNEAKVS